MAIKVQSIDNMYEDDGQTLLANAISQLAHADSDRRIIGLVPEYDDSDSDTGGRLLRMNIVTCPWAGTTDPMTPMSVAAGFLELAAEAIGGLRAAAHDAAVKALEAQPIAVEKVE